METTGAIVRRLYKEQGLTQEKLAQKAGVGTTTVQKVICNEHVSKQVLKKIANALGVELSVICDLETEKLAITNARTTGEKIGAICQSKGINQSELAEKVGVKNSTISNVINGKKEPRTDTLIRIANVLNMTLDDICIKPISELSAEEKIKRAYQKKGFTQKGFARSLGIAQESIKSATTDVFSVRHETLQRIANALELEITELYEGYQERARGMELPEKIKLLCRVKGIEQKEFEAMLESGEDTLRYQLYKNKTSIGIITFKRWAEILEVPLDVFCNEEELIREAMKEENVGLRIKRLREVLGMTKSELMRKSNVSHTTISGIEAGTIIPRANIFAKIANALNVDFDELLYGI